MVSPNTDGQCHKVGSSSPGPSDQVLPDQVPPTDTAIRRWSYDQLDRRTANWRPHRMCVSSGHLSTCLRPRWSAGPPEYLEALQLLFLFLYDWSGGSNILEQLCHRGHQVPRHCEAPSQTHEDRETSVVDRRADTLVHSNFP